MFQPPLQVFAHAMPDYVKESAPAAGLPNLVGHGATILSPADQRADINDWYGRVANFLQCFHMTILILKDVRENLQVDLQSARLRDFIAITQPHRQQLSGG